MQSLPDALAPLAAFEQFILYKLVPSKKQPGKINKLPVDHRTLQVFEEGDGDGGWQKDPAAWTDATTAINLVGLCGLEYGVGFFFTPNDPFFFVDIDSCLEPDGAAWSPVANDLMGRLAGAAVEISQSGKGLHIFGIGACPEHACKNVPFKIELYTEGRFAALTGDGAIGSANFDCSATLPDMVSTYYPPKITVRGNEWTTEPLSEYTHIDNDVLIEKAKATKSVAAKFGSGVSFEDLWTNNEEALADKYPPDDNNGKDPYDRSSVDAALAQHLAFWTGCNCNRILSLMWQSGLVRDKWSDRKNKDKYLIETITRAISWQEIVYTGGKKKELERVPVTPTQPLGTIAGPEIAFGYQFLDISRQIEHFTGCVYIQDQHKIFTPNGALLKSDQFNATYGGYVFQLDGEASGKTTKKAWEAFTESQGVRYPIAESSTFRPDLESRALIEHEGRVLINTYIPIVTERKEGDATPFLDHLALLLPNEQDRAILLAYMAAVIQHKGIKFQWCPLIQGAPGNGKSLLTWCVQFAVGERHTHLPPAEQIAEKYNDWLFDRIFIGVEDIYLPEHKREVIQILLPMITNKRLAKRAMNVGQVMHSVCANFMLNANRKDAIPKTIDDRRFSIFYSAQQSEADIIRDGMGGDYFPKMYDWLSGGGYAIVAQYLETYAIPNELNPAGACHRAPKTSSTNEAINVSLGGVEQEILEAIDEGRIGFCKGWISSMALERLLQSIRKAGAIPHNRRRELLQSLGYEWHPALKNGRVNNFVQVDGGKPRLFIKAGHIHANLETAADVVHHYQEAQQGATPVPGSAGAKFQQ